MKKQVQQHKQFPQWEQYLSYHNNHHSHNSPLHKTTPNDVATNSGPEYDVSIPDGKPLATAQRATITAEDPDGDHPLANKAIDELKKELGEAKAANTKEQGKKPDRPVIHAGQTDNQWLLFLDSWERYKELSNLTKPERIRNELREVCAGDVNELLFNSTDLNSSTVCLKISF